MRIVLVSVLFLTGCITTTVSEKLPLQVPDSPELKMRPVTWNVHDSEICLSPEMYSNLSLNTEDIKAIIEYQNNVIRMYKEYYNSTIPKKQ